MDIALQDTGDGAEIVLSGGDVKGDGSLFNSVYLSLFNGDCYSNALEEHETNNDFENALNAPITIKNLQEVEKVGKEALKWMLSEGVADSVDVYAYGGESNKIEVQITITEPSKENCQFALVWENQKAILKAI